MPDTKGIWNPLPPSGTTNSVSGLADFHAQERMRLAEMKGRDAEPEGDPKVPEGRTTRVWRRLGSLLRG